jgi:hypothetical protein
MKKEKIGTIDMNMLMLNRRKFTTSEISRGTGVIMPKKGKGSYKRKNKHKTDYSKKDSWFYFFSKFTINLEI